VIALPLSPADADRQSLRQRLLAERDVHAGSAVAPDAAAALAQALLDTLMTLEPECLGLYSAMRREFNVAAALHADPRFAKTGLALPYARRTPRALSFRRWQPGRPTVADECGIASSDGAEVEPDVVVIPCVGFTAGRHRLGFGGGYYDRWLAAHPGVTSVGVAGSFAEIDEVVFAARPHDIALTIIVTERGAR